MKSPSHEDWLLVWALVFVGLGLAIMAAKDARGHSADFAEMAALMPETIVEYRDPPPSVCGNELGVDLRLQRGETRDVTTTVRVECGEVLKTDGPFPRLDSCVRVRAQNALGDQVSEMHSIDDAQGACMPVPEGRVGHLLGVGLLGLAGLGRRRGC